MSSLGLEMEFQRKAVFEVTTTVDSITKTRRVTVPVDAIEQSAVADILEKIGFVDRNHAP